MPLELEQVKGSESQAPHHREFDRTLVDITYSFSHEYHEEQGVRGRGSSRDDLSDLKIKGLFFGG